MSDIQLKQEVIDMINNAGYAKSEELVLPVSRIISKKFEDVSFRRIYEVVKSIM